ncbi:Aminoacylase-1 [Bienertia sinuspersici]
MLFQLNPTNGSTILSVPTLILMAIFLPEDMKCVGMQYLEAIRKLKASGFEPTRTIYISFVPDEENGGLDGAEKLAESDLFEKMNVAFVLDEGMPSPNEKYQVFYAERSLVWLVIKAIGAPGHGAKLYDNTAMENLMKSIDSIRSFRASQFDMVKAGLKTEGDVVLVNMVFLKAGTQTPTGFVMNLQPSEAEAGFDLRVPPTADLKSLEKRISEEWAPASRNMTFEFVQKDPLLDKFGKPILTVADNSNPWWFLFEEAVQNAGGKLEIPEILLGSTDASFFRQRGLPAIGFSAIANTPDRVHDHNEFLNQEEYLKGIDMYASIIKAYASYAVHTEAEASTYELFQQYLRINTAHPNPNYYEAADFILSQAKSLSLESQTIEFVKNKPLVLLKWPGKPPELPSILLNSHTDVVPVESHKWTYHPFDAHVDSDGNIYARVWKLSHFSFNSLAIKCLALVVLALILGAVLFPTFSGVDVKGKLEIDQLQPISFNKVFQFNKFNSLCNGFIRLGRYSELSNQTDVLELEKGGGRKWTSMRDFEQLKEFSSGDPYDHKEEIIKQVGNIKELNKPTIVYLAVADSLLEDKTILSGWQEEMLPLEKKKLGDMKSVGMQYLEAIRLLKNSGFEPTRTIYLSYVPDEEIGGRDGAEKLAESDVFKKMNVAFVLDEGRPSADEKYQAYYAERSPMWLVIKAVGAPGHGAKLYDDTAMENLLGFVMNMQPSEAEAGIDIRVPPTEDQEALERRVAEEWAPVSRNMTYEFKEKFPIVNKFGKPAITVADNSNPWWVLLEEAVQNAGGELEKRISSVVQQMLVSLDNEACQL